MASTYKRGYSFSGFQSNQPQRPLPAQHVDIELDKIAHSFATQQAQIQALRPGGGGTPGPVLDLPIAGLSVKANLLAAPAIPQVVGFDQFKQALGIGSGGGGLPDWSDVQNKPTFGTAAARDVGAGAGQVAAGDDPRIVGALQGANNGTDIPNKGLFRDRLGLKGAAVLDVGVAGGVAGYDDLRATVSASQQYAIDRANDRSRPRWYAAVYGVVANTGADQRANLQAALASIPQANANGSRGGGILVLPTGIIDLSAGLTNINIQNLTIEGAGATGTIIRANFKDGDVLVLKGHYNTVRDIAFDTNANVLPLKKWNKSNNTLFDVTAPLRTSGYYLNMAGAYATVERVSMQHGYRGICMNPAAGWCRVASVDMTEWCPDSVSAGSGGIIIDNTNYGPANIVEHCTIYGDAFAKAITVSSGVPIAVDPPRFGLQIANSGASHIKNNDFLGFINNVLINPQPEKVAEASFFTNNYFDSAQGDNVLLQPVGSGHVYYTYFTSNWIVNTGRNATTQCGLRLDGSNAPAGCIQDTKWSGGCIYGVSAEGCGSGVLIDGNARNSFVTGATVAGWDIGVNLGANAQYATIKDNEIGPYSPFGAGNRQNNNIGIALTAGNGDFLTVDGNVLYGNATSILSQGPTGSFNSLTNNAGFNGTSGTTDRTSSLPASNGTLRNGNTPAQWAFFGTGSFTIVDPRTNVAIASGLPAYVTMSPNESLVLVYDSTNLTAARKGL